MLHTPLRTVVVWLAIVAAASKAPADPYAEVMKYQVGQPRTAVAAIEAEIRTAKPEQLRQIETRLLAILESPAATTDAKAWVCRQLRQAGSERSAEALGALLNNPELANFARLALQSIPGAKVDAVLREAVGKLDGDLKAGAVLTIGARADRQATPILAPLASDANPTVAEAALYALGQIGAPEALAALQAAKTPDRLSRYRLHAILRCAERLAADGKSAEAAAVYRQLAGPSSDAVIRAAALRGVLAVEKAKAAPEILNALRDANPKIGSAAAKAVGDLGDAATWAAVLAELPKLPSQSQAVLLRLVCDPSARPVVLKAVQSDQDDVRLAALEALGRIGDQDAVPLLLNIAVAEKGPSQAAAREALHALPGKGANAALVSAVTGQQPAARVEAIRVLAARGATEATPLLLNTARDADKAVRLESLAALATLAKTDSLPALVRLLVEAKAEDRSAAEQAVLAVARRSEDAEAAAGCVLAAMAGQGIEIRTILLRVAARIPSRKALDALRAARRDAEPAMVDAAIRGLAEWPDGAPLGDLLEIARASENKTHKVLALRGFIRLASLPKARPAAESVKLLAQAMPLAARAEEKRMVLAAVAQLRDPAGLDLATTCLADKEVEVEAATAVVQIAKTLRGTNPDAAAAAIRKVLEVCQSPAARQVAEGASIVLGEMVNIATQGTATSPDGLDKDGGAGGDQAAIDGDVATYWDEQDNQKLYRLVVTFKQPEKIAALTVVGYEHHQYAPKDFEVLADGKPIKTVANAQYDDNYLVIRLEETTCTSVELKITGYYGNSPAIRELGIYRPARTKP